MNTTESKCILTRAPYGKPNDFISNEGIPSRFYGQCTLSLTPKSVNIFSEWLESAWRSKLPTIEVLENTVEFDWGEAATKFPEGIIN